MSSADAGLEPLTPDCGFSIEPGVFSRSEMTAVLEALNLGGVPRTRAGARHVLSVESNGPLRVLPNSHMHGVLSDIEIEQWVARRAQIDCTTEAGGVVAMRPLTLHASSKSIDRRPRRVLHIEYAATVDFGNGVKLAMC